MNYDDIIRLKQEKEYMENNPDIFDTETIRKRLVKITNEIQEKSFFNTFENFKIPLPQEVFEFLLYYGGNKDCSDFFDEDKSNYCLFLLQKYYPNYLPRKLQENIEIENYEDCALIKGWLDIKIDQIPNLPF